MLTGRCSQGTGVPVQCAASQLQPSWPWQPALSEKPLQEAQLPEQSPGSQEQKSWALQLDPEVKLPQGSQLPSQREASHAQPSWAAQSLCSAWAEHAVQLP
jgi:hypothetical protein